MGVRKVATGLIFEGIMSGVNKTSASTENTSIFIKAEVTGALGAGGLINGKSQAACQAAFEAILSWGAGTWDGVTGEGKATGQELANKLRSSLTTELGGLGLTAKRVEVHEPGQPIAFDEA